VFIYFLFTLVSREGVNGLLPVSLVVGSKGVTVYFPVTPSGSPEGVPYPFGLMYVMEV
jgi:hypothetical protein